MCSLKEEEHRRWQDHAGMGQWSKDLGAPTTVIGLELHIEDV
jgi:hypothetical protein